ncbi:TPA: hypothetical protein U1W61_000687 [Streptococcus suis]|nr:hypothetical protein [Streptococcus suis]
MVGTVTFNQAMLAKDRVFAIRAGTYTSSDIKEANFNYGYISGDTFKPGGTVAGSSKLIFTSIITTFNKLDKIYPEIGLLVGDSYEWVAMGEYFVNDISIDRNRNTTELDLMDGMFKLNQPYVSDLTYPAQIRDVIREICVKTGIELETDNLGLKAIQRHIEAKADKKDITFREVLSQAIQLLGFSAFFNRKGKLEVRGLTESRITVTADNYFLHGLTKSEIQYQIAGITCKKDKETLTVGLRTGRSLELENSFMNQNLLDELYYELKDIKYYPFSLDWQGHLKLDVGQWVTLKTNKNETYKVPVLSQSFSFKGGLKSKISADSKAGNDTQYSYKGFLTKQIEQMSTQIDAEIQQQLEYANAEFDRKTEEYKKELDNGIEQAKAEAELYADNIKRSIDTEIAQVNQSMQAQSEEHDRQVADILSKTQSVEELANQAKTDAASAIQRSSQLKAEAVAEANRLVQAQSTALTERIRAVDIRVDDVANQISSKVSQIDFDAVKKTVESNSTAITQNQSAIELKADKTVTDALATAVNQTKSELKITGDAVATKVSKTDFDATNQRLATAETTIRTQAGQIEQRLTSTQVESLVVGKGYATSTVVQNLVKETSDTFKKSISETKKLIPTNFDNTNLLSVSNLKNGWFDGNGILQLTTMYVNTDYIELDSNTSYIWQTWTKSRNWVGLVLFDSQKQYITGSYRSVTVDSYVKQTIESGNAKYIVFSFDKSILDGAIKSKLEKGAIATEWVPAYQDLVSTTEFHEVADTVDSHKRTISEQGQSISQAIQTANGLLTKVSALDKSDNLFSFEKSTKGFWIDRNGSTIAGKTYSHSDFLKLASDGTYQLQVWNKSSDKKWIGFTRYTSDKSYISDSYRSFEIESNGYKLLSFTNFDGYLIISYGSYTTDNMTGLEIQFERGLVATAYKPSTLDFATQTQVNTLAGSWAVQNLTSAGEILNQFNLLADGTNRIDGRLTHITGQTLIDDAAITSAKIASLDAGKITSGYISAERLDAKSITAAKLKVDQAFFDALAANRLLVKDFFAKDAVVTSIQAVTLSATQINSGVLKAFNDRTTLDLSTGKLTFNDGSPSIEFNSDTSAIRRVTNGQSQFIKFASYLLGTQTTIGANRKANDESIGTADFTGIQIQSRAGGVLSLIDKVYVCADEFVVDGGGGQVDGFVFKNREALYPQSSGMLNLGRLGNRWNNVYAFDYYVGQNAVNLRAFLDAVRACFHQIAYGGMTQTTYDLIKNNLTNTFNKIQ